MTEVAYAVLDANGKIINHLISVEPPILDDKSHSCVVNTCKAGIGWICKKGKLIDPEDTVSKLNAMPPVPFPPSMDDHTKQIAALQADIQTLSASLTQVINTLNTLTRPNSASRK